MNRRTDSYERYKLIQDWVIKTQTKYHLTIFLNSKAVRDKQNNIQSVFIYNFFLMLFQL